ncbi:MAG: hypothetical protein JNM78_03290 [Cyclobacteriaceae bacterium]|nr:hypothetical protein [Cyclobacteriaceae bacterium]
MESKPELISSKQPSRPKSTINLGNILKGQPKEEIKKEEKNITTSQNKPVSENQLREAWNEFAEQRKNQMAEYHLLKQEFSFKNNVISLYLTNSIEEPLLQSVRSDLLAYLREKLSNSGLQIEGVMQEHQTRKIAYTNKEKFEYLAEKNPALYELKEKLGLDPDF